MFLVLESSPTSWTFPFRRMSRGRARQGREALAPTTEHSCFAGGLPRGQLQAGGLAGQLGEHSRGHSQDIQRVS